MEKKYEIVTNNEYGYLCVDPLPPKEEVERFYLDDFYSANYKRFNDSSLAVQKEEQEFFNSRWESICAICNKYFGKVSGLSVFDIGCGFGQALLYLREKGMVVNGLEPSEEGVKYAASQGLKVFRCGIEDFPCISGDQRYEIVLLINVLEHLRYPADTILNIKEKLLKNNGLLVIDVPNEFNDFQTIADSEYNLHKWWVCPPNHINYFSASSLKNLLSKCGYDIVHCESSFPLEMFILMGDVYVGNPDLGKKCHARRAKFEHLMRKHGKADKLSKLYELFAGLDLGRQVTVYAAPKK